MIVGGRNGPGPVRFQQLLQLLVLRSGEDWWLSGNGWRRIGRGRFVGDRLWVLRILLPGGFLGAGLLFLLPLTSLFLGFGFRLRLKLGFFLCLGFRGIGGGFGLPFLFRL